MTKFLPYHLKQYEQILNRYNPTENDNIKWLSYSKLHFTNGIKSILLILTKPCQYSLAKIEEHP